MWLNVSNQSQELIVEDGDRSASADGSGDGSGDLVLNILIAVFLSAIIIAAILGNVLVCCAVYTERSLRRIGNLFIVSLAVADLLVSSLVMTFAVPNDITGIWMFGPQFCDTWLAFDVLCSTASILNLCAISLDRYICISDPFKYQQWMSKRVVLLAIAVIWLVSGLISFLPISLGLHRPDDAAQTDPPTCTMDLTPTYAVISSLISFYIPCGVMIALYSRLYMYARKHIKEIQKITKPLTHGVATETSHHVSDHKAAVTLGFIVGVFLFCWVPFFLTNIVSGFCKTCVPEIVFKGLTWLGYLNSALNPAIYSIFNHEFRDAFRKILTGRSQGCCCCCIKYCGRGSSRGDQYWKSTNQVNANARRSRADTANSNNGTATHIRAPAYSGSEQDSAI